MAEDTSTISSTSICLKITDEWFTKLNEEEQASKLKEINSLLEKKKSLMILTPTEQHQLVLEFGEELRWNVLTLRRYYHGLIGLTPL